MGRREREAREELRRLAQLHVEITISEAKESLHELGSVIDACQAHLDALMDLMVADFANRDEYRAKIEQDRQEIHRAMEQMAEVNEQVRLVVEDFTRNYG